MALAPKSNDGFMSEMLKKAKAAEADLQKAQENTAKAKENLEDAERASQGIRENTRKAAQNTGDAQREIKATVTEAMKLKAAFEAMSGMSMKFMRAFEKVNGQDWRKTIKNVGDLERKITALGKNDKVFGLIDEDDAAKAVAKVKSAVDKLQAQQDRAAAKNKQTNQEQTRTQKEFNTQLERTTVALERITDVYKKLNQAITSGGFMQVKVSNSGFQSVVTEMSKAIENYKKHNKGNFFTNGLKKSVTEADDEVKDAATELGDTVGKAFSSDDVKEKISKSVSKAIKDGIISGLRAGTSEGLSNLGGVTMADNIAELMAKLDEKNVRRASVNYIADKIFDGAPMSDKQKTSVAKARAKYEAQAKVKAKVDIKNIEETEETKRQLQEQTHRKEMEHLRAERAERERNSVLEANPEQMARIAKALASIESGKAALARKQNKDEAEYSAERLKQKKLATELMMLEIQQNEENLKKTRDWTSRKQAVLEDWVKTEKELEAEMANNGGRELTAVDQALAHMDELIAKRHDLEMQSRDGVRNTAQQVKNFHDMVKQIKLVAAEQYKLTAGYEEQDKSLKKALEHYQRMDRYLQAIGNTISGATRTWNQFGSMIQNIFGRFRNGIMNLFSTGRSQLRTLVTDATEQYGKLERAQVGFTNFFGSKQSQRLITQIQQEAIKAPALSSGDLADYVAQLAPVSNGNADLALNATMGILKSIQYSGGDASTEMSRVVANMRDVIAKGKANTIDIRQFERAMPAIEKALSELGASEFLQDGRLTITKENAKTLMEAFARLNTDPASPVKNIFAQMGNTIEALQEAFKERRTQMMMNVLTDSGAYDMMKGALTAGNESGLLYKLQSFLTKTLKSVIDWIKTIDWERVGTAFKSGWDKIRDALENAGKLIGSALPNVDGWTVLETVFNAIKRIIEGFAQGVKTTIDVFKNMFGGISPEVIEKAASVVGFMLSPVHKLFSTIGSLATSVLSFAQNTNKTLAQFTQSRIRNYEAAISQAAEMQARLGVNGLRTANGLKRFKNMTYDTATNLYTRTMASGERQSGYLYGGTFIPQSMYSEMKDLGSLKTAVKDQIAKDTYGKPLEELNQLQYYKVSAKYTGGTISNWWQKTLNTFTAQLGKIVNGGQLIAFGSSLSAMSDKANIAAQVFASLVSSFGLVQAGSGIGSTIGSLFGNAGVGGKIGTLVTTVIGIANTVYAWYEADRADKAKKAQENLTKAENEYIGNMGRTVMDALGLDETKTESAKYVYNEVMKAMNGSSMMDLVGQGKYGNSVEEVLQYFTEFAQGELNRYYRSSYLEMLDDFKEDNENEMTEEAKAFHAATGKEYSNWGDNASADELAAREWIANLVREHGLLSDGQVQGLLSEATDQKVVEAFLKDFNGTINEGQLKILKDRFEEANQMFPSEADKISTQLKENTDAQTTLKSSIDTLNQNAQTIIREGINVTMNGGTIEGGESKQTLQSIAGAKSQGTGLWSDMFGGISTGYQAAKKNQLFDDQTQALFRSQKYRFSDPDNTLTQLAQYMEEMGVDMDKMKKTKFWQGVGPYQGRDKISGLYQMLLNKADEYKGDPDKLASIGRAYTILEEKSFVGLSAEDSTRQMAEILKKIMALGDWIFEAKGGLINSAFSGRGVDTVPAFLQPGEFVMRRGSVMKAGLGVMSALNRGDMAAAARGLGSRLITGGEFNNSRNWSSITNNNQRTNNNVFNIVNRNMSARMNTYHSLANRIATA